MHSVAAALPAYRGTYRAAIVGHTGRGDFAHGLDRAFVGLPRIEVVGVADPIEAGRQQVAALNGAPKTYADYHEMLERERPDLVAIAPRWLDQRVPMVTAAASSGAKAIYLEKPFARSLDEADAMVDVCVSHGVKLGLAHQNRAFPAPHLARQLIEQGRIGRLRAMRGYTKHDERGGGLELLLHGTHLFDLMRWFAGTAGHEQTSTSNQEPDGVLAGGQGQTMDARWCHARITQGGRDVTVANARYDDEGGWVAGDDVVASYGFDGGVTGWLESMRADDGGGTPYFHLELCGTGGVLALWSSLDSPVLCSPRPFALPDETGRWERVATDVPGQADRHGIESLHPANQALVADLLAAVEEDRQPLSSGDDGRAVLEMIVGAYESHLAGGRVALPLRRRDHPLTRPLGGRDEGGG